jgi:uncharacterized membrane protein YjfL (UPF0719 family)
MKKISLLILLIVFQITAMACPVCEKQQPKLLKGISHGSGPQDTLDYLIVWATVIIVAITLIYTIKYLAKPGEKNSNHIKNTVIN